MTSVVNKLVTAVCHCHCAATLPRPSTLYCGPNARKGAGCISLRETFTFSHTSKWYKHLGMLKIDTFKSALPNDYRMPDKAFQCFFSLTEDLSQHLDSCKCGVM